MKKSFLSLFSLCVLTTVAFSQNSRSQLSLSFGPSLSVGNFGSIAANNTLSGYATTGISSALSFSYGLKNNFAFEISLYGQQNRLNSSAMEEQLEATGFFYNPPVQNEASYYSNWSVPGKKWSVAALQIGLSRRFTMGGDGRLYIMPRVMAGVAYAHLPAVTSESKMDTAYAVYAKSKLEGFGVAAVGGIHFGYQLSPRMSTGLLAEYLTTNQIRLKDVATSAAATRGGLIVAELHSLGNSHYPPYHIGYRTDEKQTINSVSLRARISYRL